MSKKLLMFLVPGVIVILFVLVFLIIGKRNGLKEEPLRAVPVDAGILIKVNDFSSLIGYFHENALWNALNKIPVFENIDHQINVLDSIMKNNPDVRPVLLSSPSYISLHAVGKETGFIHFFRLPGDMNERRINEMVKNLTGSQGEMKSRKYEGSQIYDVNLKTGKRIKNFSYTVTRGLLILSYSSIMVEDAIRQLSDGTSVMDNKEFRKAFGTAGKNVPANVFIHFDDFPKLVASRLKNEYRQIVRGYDYFASWAELDLNIKENTLLLNGFTVVSDSVPQLFNLFRDQSPEKITVDNVLPSSVSSFLCVSLSDVKAYYENYTKFLAGRGEINPFQQRISSLKLKYGIDFNDSFISLMEGEFAVALEEPGRNEQNGSFALFRVRSQAHTERKMKEVLGKIADRNSVPVDSYIHQVKIDNELSYPVYKLDIRNFLTDYFGDFFASITGNYFVISDSYLVFGNSINSLKNYIRSNVLRGTLNTEPAYREFKDNLAPRSTVCFYSDLSRGPYVFSSFLSPGLLKGWEDHLEAFRKVQVFGLQMNGGNDMMYTSMFLRSVPEYKDKPHTVWESLLDTTFDFKPQFVTNHTDNQPEIFIQDLAHSIYLINQAGRILWKQNLTEKINSPVYQIDYFNNGKLQMLFSTTNYIHLIDRNGNYVERYPVKLRSPATNGLALFDYDSNKNYRFMIACEDKNVYAYTKDGSLLQGWDFKGTEGTVDQPVNLFQTDGKDYIVFGDDLNTYILNRKGETRVEVKELIPFSKNNDFYFYSTGKAETSAFVSTDTSGSVYFIHTDGKVEKTFSAGLSPGHYFDFKDINGDGKKDYIFLDDDRLMVYSADSLRIFSYSSADPVKLPPVVYQFSSSDKKIGLVSQQEQQIFLINNDGTLYNGFPLSGKTLFSIGHFESDGVRFNLIVGGEENFLYNYIVQ